MDTTLHTLTIDGLAKPLRAIRYGGREAMSDAFEFDIYVVSEDAQLAFADIAGKRADFVFGNQPDTPRHVHGLVRRFEYVHHHSHHTTYRAVVVPRAWRLTLRKNNRIFQGKSVPDILAAVIGEAGIEPHTLALSGSYAPREYCVQYRESDWDFINRLMEEEGIFYFFEQGASEAKLIIADHPSAHDPIEGDATVKFRGETGLEGGEHVHRLRYGQEVRPGKVTMRDYNFKTPAVSLESSSAADTDDDLELYSFPGNYPDTGIGDGRAARQLEAFQASRKSGEGESNVSRLTPGHKFTLGDTPADVLRDDLAQEYLVTRIEHEGSEAQIDGVAAKPYANRFSVVPASVPYRPLPRTERPRIFGIQTAVVTGPGGEEIHTDEHGRIKVQFFWDRKGKKDENSSCWVRVKQPWAGPGWGNVFIPRIGQEVVIEFIEGDPDRPLCSGAVYHAANVPPYPLPAEKTKSTVKTDSSIGGGGYNELRFEDLKGSEEIYLQGEKDWNILIKHDKSQKIGHDESLDVGHDQTIHIGHDRQKTVDNDQLEVVKGNKTIDVTKNHTETVHGNETITVEGNETVTINKSRTHTVLMADTETITLAQTSSIGAMWNKSVGGAMTLNVGLKKSESVGGSSTETVGAGKSVSVGGNYDETVAQDKTVSITKKMTLTVSEDLAENIKKNRKADIGESLQINCGEVTITIKKDGSITVEGKDIKVKSGGTVEVEAKKLQVKSDGAIDVKASGDVTVKGGQVKMN